MICCNHRLQSKRMHHAKPPGKQRINATTIQNSTKSAMTIKSLKHAHLANLPRWTVHLRWDTPVDTIHITVLPGGIGARHWMVRSMFEWTQRDHQEESPCTIWVQTLVRKLCKFWWQQKKKNKLHRRQSDAVRMTPGSICASAYCYNLWHSLDVWRNQERHQPTKM